MKELVNPVYRLVITTLEGIELVYEEIAEGEEGLNVEYNIKKTRNTQPNPAFFTIYNTSPESQAHIAKKWMPYATKGQKIEFYFGWRGQESKKATQLDLLYTGEIREAVPRRVGMENVLKIEAGVELGTLRSDKSFDFEGPLSGEDALKGLVSTAGKKLEVLKDAMVFLAKRLFNGKSLSGNFKALLDEFGKPLGVNMDVQENTVNVSLPGEPDPAKPVIYLNENSGMIDSPEVTHKGVNVESILQVEIEPGCLLKLGSTTMPKGYGDEFTVEQASYSGKTDEGDAKVSIEAFTYKKENTNGESLSTSA